MGRKYLNKDDDYRENIAVIIRGLNDIKHKIDCLITLCDTNDIPNCVKSHIKNLSRSLDDTYCRTLEDYAMSLWEAE